MCCVINLYQSSVTVIHFNVGYFGTNFDLYFYHFRKFH